MIDLVVNTPKPIQLPRLPKKIWVVTWEFDVHLVPDAHPMLEGNDGMTYFEEDQRGIYLSQSMQPRRLLEVFWHEAEHAINWSVDIDDGIEEETLCELHGKAWTDFLLNNPRFESWLTKMTKFIRHERKNA
jgi:hypothetical protein